VITKILLPRAFPVVNACSLDGAVNNKLGEHSYSAVGDDSGGEYFDCSWSSPQLRPITDCIRAYRSCRS
jgi:hypothetical protein